MTEIISELGRAKRSPLAKNAGWVLAGQGLSVLLQAGYFVILARLLGPTEYGVYAGAFALTAIVSQYSSLGSGTLFLRYVSADPNRFGAYWANVLLTTACIGCVIVLALRISAPFLLNAASSSIVVPAAVANCVCNQLTNCAGQVFQAYEKLRTTAFLNALTNLMRFLLAAALLLQFHHATAWGWALAALIVSALVSCVAVVLVTRRFGRPTLDLRLVRDSVREGFEYAFATSTSSAYNDIDKTMLSHYGMNTGNGIYTMAYRVIDVATIPIFAIRDAAMPRFFRDGATGLGGSAKLAVRLLLPSVVLGLAAASLLAALAPVLPRVVGNGFRDSVSALRWLCLIPVFRSVHQITGSALTGAGLQRYRTVTQTCASVLNFSLNLWLIPSYGWLGAAWVSLITDLSLGGMNGLILLRLADRSRHSGRKRFQAQTIRIQDRSAAERREHCVERPL